MLYVILIVILMLLLLGGDAPLELQSQLGLLTKRRTRIDCADFNCPSAAGTNLTMAIFE